MIRDYVISPHGLALVKRLLAIEPIEPMNKELKKTQITLIINEFVEANYTLSQILNNENFENVREKDWYRFQIELAMTNKKTILTKFLNFQTTVPIYFENSSYEFMKTFMNYMKKINVSFPTLSKDARIVLFVFFVSTFILSFYYMLLGFTTSSAVALGISAVAFLVYFAALGYDYYDTALLISNDGTSSSSNR